MKQLYFIILVIVLSSFTLYAQDDEYKFDESLIDKSKLDKIEDVETNYKLTSVSVYQNGTKIFFAYNTKTINYLSNGDLEFTGIAYISKDQYEFTVFRANCKSKRYMALYAYGKSYEIIYGPIRREGVEAKLKGTFNESKPIGITLTSVCGINSLTDEGIVS